MKFTDKFFRFPIKIYDGVSARKMIKKELKNLDTLGDEDEEEDIDWVQGDVKIPFWGLENLFYHEGYTPGRSTEDVAKNGFDLTYVSHTVYGDFECMWDMKKFEDRLNAFVEKHEAYHKEQLTNKIEEALRNELRSKEKEEEK
jgi:hypothetical protein